MNKPRSRSPAEIIAVLNEISRISARLARNIAALAGLRQSGKEMKKWEK